MSAADELAGSDSDGWCDRCRGWFDPADRVERCGDCGLCGECCDHCPQCGERMPYGPGTACYECHPDAPDMFPRWVARTFPASAGWKGV